jgi:hypothetical protein
MILFYGKPSNTKIGHMLSFSSGVMLCIPCDVCMFIMCTFVPYG